MAKDDGGPAFPQTLDSHPVTAAAGLPSQGMTLRDYFAAAAMKMFLHPQWVEITSRQLGGDAEMVRAFIAAKAYRYADAMLTERNKP